MLIVGQMEETYINSVSRKEIQYMKTIGKFLIYMISLGIGGGLFLLNIMSSITMKLWIWTMNKADRRRIILNCNNKQPYLERYYIFLRNRQKHIPFNIFIHKFLQNSQNEFHDYPWGFFTLVLKGGFWEHIYTDNRKIETKRIWRHAGYWQKVDAEYTHRIELETGKGPCWTLCIPFKKERTWGFWKQTQIENKDQHENENENENNQSKDEKETIEWIESKQFFLDNDMESEVPRRKKVA